MSGYIGTQPVPQATQTRDAFTATSGQTSFATSGYTPNFLDVFLNGVKLSAADYTASNGSDVVLATGAATGDILEVVAYSSFEVVTDTVTNAGTVLNLDRTGSDGTILDLKKDSASVGSIGTAFSNTYIAGTNYGLRFYNAGVLPCDTSGNAANNLTDLGTTNTRFKDLYLSGGVVFGDAGGSGTSTSNTLDSYEEGTWTPTSVTSGTISVGSTGAHYTKVGRNVTLHINSAQFSDSTSTNDITIGGVPFAPSGSSAVGTTMMSFRDDTIAIAAYIPSTGAEIRFYRNSETTGYTRLRHNIFNSGSHSFYLSITYQTA